MATPHHRHDFSEPIALGDEWACVECSATSPACRACRTQPGRATGSDLRICDRCLWHWKGILAETGQAVASMSDAQRTLTGIRSSAGYDLATARTLTEAPLPYGLGQHEYDPAQDNDAYERPATYEGALDTLDTIAAIWTEHGAAIGESWWDLADRLAWAADTLDRSLLADHLEQIRHACNLIRRITGYGHVSVNGVRCFSCGSRLRREQDAHGVQDVAKCPNRKCGRVYKSAEFRLAQLARIQTAPENAPDALVTFDQAVVVLPKLNRETVRWWVHKERLERHGTDRHGEYLYRVGDLAELLGMSPVK